MVVLFADTNAPTEADALCCLYSVGGWPIGVAPMSHDSTVSLGDVRPLHLLPRVSRLPVEQPRQAQERFGQAHWTAGRARAHMITITAEPGGL
jgi:hypothetical protein